MDVGAVTASGHGTTLYVLGTSDTAGHDELLGMLAGAQVSLEVAILSTFFGLLFGVVLGMRPATSAAPPT